ncbi:MULTISPECIES: hypothetical protein [Nocardioides]|uniref:DUF308 domain-containing protein n=1 Tax=Nocardioides vastitatis TaxID=2568655 RepID=A0ABW0ZGF0_9ACTN|nr:hypothetical protein [Nocardioides sp.]THJ11336.1 hypothetical protein E7Z54_02415 [Nocardioides sp.]
MQREPDDHDATWRSIVENYGDPVLEPDEELAPQVEPAAPAWNPDDDSDRIPAELDDTFVPPPAPPIPRPSSDRLLAWLGLFGAPAILLFFVVTGIDIPRLVAWVLVGGFIAGFGYLVARMPSSPRDPWDDGAQL